jgi:hypothetical protein
LTALFAATGASGTSLGIATITASTDVLTITAHGLVNGQVVVTSGPTGGAVGVLVPAAPYYVANATANTFQLRSSPGGAVLLFATDGTAVVDVAESVYSARGMRQALSGLLYKARDSIGVDIGQFGVRPGVLQNGTTSEITISGFTVNVRDFNCVLNPTAAGTQGAGYLCAIPATALTVTAADGSNPRKDIVVGRMRDNTEDSSGFIVDEVYLITGTPASIPVAPSTPAGQLYLGTIDVPVSGGGNPTLTYNPTFTVAIGGILPVADNAGLPTIVRREGMYADQADTNTLMRWSGSAWEAVASPVSFQSRRRIQTTTRTTTSATFTTTETSINTVVAALENGKTYQIRWVTEGRSSVAADTAKFRLREDTVSGTILQAVNTALPVASTDFQAVLEVEYTAVATGNKTFVGTCARNSGTGNVSVSATANEPHYLYVEYLRG